MKYLSFFSIIKFKDQIKNLIIFIPCFFTGELNFFSNNFINSLQLYFLFIIASSLTYSINNLCDFEEDKIHPIKKKFFFYKIPNIKLFIKYIIFVFIIIYFILFFYLEINYISKFYSFVYIILITIYSYRIKLIPYLELFILPLGYILRLFSATLVTGTKIDIIIYLLMYFSVLFIILSKRFSEFSKYKDYRSVLRFYNKNILITLMLLSCFLITFLHIIYTLKESVFFLYGYLGILSNLFIIIILLRILVNSLYNFKLEDPIYYILFNDKISLILIIVYIAYFYSKIYI